MGKKACTAEARWVAPITIESLLGKQLGGWRAGKVCGVERVQVSTLMRTSCTFSSARKMGLPTIEGKMCAGKLSPAKPHFTNCGDTRVHRSEPTIPSCE